MRVNGASLCRAFRCNLRWDIVKALLGVSDIDVNVQDNEGKAALHYAARSDATLDGDIVKALLGVSGINVNVQDNEGISSLHYATYNTNVDVLRLLAAAPGILPNIRTTLARRNWSPLIWTTHNVNQGILPVVLAWRW